MAGEPMRRDAVPRVVHRSRYSTHSKPRTLMADELAHRTPLANRALRVAVPDRGTGGWLRSFETWVIKISLTTFKKPFAPGNP